MDKTDRIICLNNYHQCLLDCSYDDLLKPLQGELTYLIRSYEQDIKNGPNSNFYKNKDTIDNLRVDYLLKLDCIFRKIIYSKRQNEVSNIRLYFLHLIREHRYLDVPFVLETMFFPQDAYLSDRQEYLYVLLDCLNKHISDTDKLVYYDELFNSLPEDFRMMLDTFKEYLASSNFKKHGEIAKIKAITNLIIGFYYKEKYDLSLFSKVMDYIFNHFIEIYDFIEINNNDSYIMKYILNYIGPISDDEDDESDFDKYIVDFIIGNAINNVIEKK